MLTRNRLLCRKTPLLRNANRWIHPAINQPNPRPVTRTTLRKAHQGEPSARFQMQVIEIINTLRVRFAQPPQRPPRRHLRRRPQCHDRDLSFDRIAALNIKALRPRRRDRRCTDTSIVAFLSRAWRISTNRSRCWATAIP